MALPVVPSSNIGMFAQLKESTGCTDSANISMKGLFTGTRGDGVTQNFTARQVTNLGFGGGTVNVQGYLRSWLGVNAQTSYGENNTNQSISDFPTSRAADTAGYVGQ